MTRRKCTPIREPDAEVRPVVGYEGLYSVTQDGRVWSHAKRMGVSLHGGRWLKHGLTTTGYPMVMIFKDQRGRCEQIHRLVAQSWIGPAPEHRPCVNHKDGVKTNNRAENLEWCSKAENNAHAVRTGLRVNHKKTPPEKVNSARQMLMNGAKGIDVAKALGLSKAWVSKIKNTPAFA